MILLGVMFLLLLFQMLIGIMVILQVRGIDGLLKQMPFFVSRFIHFFRGLGFLLWNL